MARGQGQGNCQEGLLACFQPLSAFRLFHAPTLLQGEILSDFASRRHWVQAWSVGLGMGEGGPKRHILDFIIPPKSPPCLAQLSAWRLTAEDFQNISRSMFTAKHVESIANYEFSVHFILLPGLCPVDPFSQFVSGKEMPHF